MNYQPSQFNHHDYKKLYDFATGRVGMKSMLHETKYRDRRIQRCLGETTFNVLHAPLEQVPLYINSNNEWAKIIAKWRLSIGR